MYKTGKIIHKVPEKSSICIFSDERDTLYISICAKLHN